MSNFRFNPSTRLFIYSNSDNSGEELIMFASSLDYGDISDESENEGSSSDLDSSSREALLQSLTHGKNITFDCAICQTNGKKGNPVILKCGHKFDQECLKPWIHNNTCPSCREPIFTDDEFKDIISRRNLNQSNTQSMDSSESSQSNFNRSHFINSFGNTNDESSDSDSDSEGVQNVLSFFELSNRERQRRKFIRNMLARDLVRHLSEF